MPFDRRDIEASLEKKGFVVVGKRDHNFFSYKSTTGVKTSVWTKTSHGSSYKVISDNLSGLMAKQCGLSNNDFKQLIECPLSRESYEKLLLETKRISI